MTYAFPGPCRDTSAQKAAAAARAGTRTALAAGEVNLTAASANVSESGSPVKIRILRWSTDEERNPVVAALTPSAPVTAAAEVAAGSRGGATRRRAGRSRRSRCRGRAVGAVRRRGEGAAVPGAEAVAVPAARPIPLRR